MAVLMHGTGSCVNPSHYLASWGTALLSVKFPSVPTAICSICNISPFPSVDDNLLRPNKNSRIRIENVAGTDTAVQEINGL